MTIEDRLAEAFSDHRRTVAAGHLLPGILDRTSSPTPWWRRSSVRAAAAVALVVAIVAVAAGGRLSDDDDDTVQVAAPTLVPAAFDEAVDPICRDLADAMSRRVVFETIEAYVLVADARRDAVAAALADLARVYDPADAPGLVAASLADLRLAALDAAAATSEAESGDFDLAARHFASLETFVGRAAEPLARHGAELCGRLVP